ncbi:hypothetical protein DN757_21030 [Paenibacillus silvae]|uniref:Uncharacterized protein n=1 Tax=Paenibacillus silvae TaxID=1325358 RepID=A0A2W6NCD0_9BACL|nr:hypothetical protein DN757_21030 [Paenibacillus silvae]
MCQLRLTNSYNLERSDHKTRKPAGFYGIVVFFCLLFFIHFSHTYPIVLTQPLVKMNLHKRSAVKLLRRTTIEAKATTVLSRKMQMAQI